jgi:hypothetical protein
LARIRHPEKQDCNNRINGVGKFFTYSKWIIWRESFRPKPALQVTPTSNRVDGKCRPFAAASTGPHTETPAAPQHWSRGRNWMSGKAFLQGRSERRSVMRAILAGLFIGSMLGLAAGTAASRHVSIAVAAPASVQQQVISTENRTLSI